MSPVWDNENLSVAPFEEWIICAACYMFMAQTNDTQAWTKQYNM